MFWDNVNEIRLTFAHQMFLVVASEEAFDDKVNDGDRNDIVGGKFGGKDKFCKHFNDVLTKKKR